MPKMTFKMSEDARLLAARLEQAKVGELITKEQLSSTIGKPIDENRGALYTAMRRVLADNNAVFGTERGTGIRRLNDDEIVDSGTSIRKSIRLKSLRGMRKLSVVEYLALSKTKQIAATAIMAVFNAARVLTTERSVRQISTHANSQSLNFRQTLDAFRTRDGYEEKSE